MPWLSSQRSATHNATDFQGDSRRRPSVGNDELRFTLVVLFNPWPASASWPYIVASGLVHLVYNVSLVRSYGRNDLALAYPIARGSSPLLVTLGAALFAHEAIGPLHALGIAMISGRIIAIALQGHHVSRAGALAALTDRCDDCALYRD
jgi:drug/metabolite transporter (DMT)-like permease